MGDYSIMGHLICSITVHPPQTWGRQQASLWLVPYLLCGSVLC